MEFSPKCVFSICLEIRKSAEHNFESKNIIREKLQGASEVPRSAAKKLSKLWCLCGLHGSLLLSAV